MLAGPAFLWRNDVSYSYRTGDSQRAFRRHRGASSFAVTYRALVLFDIDGTLVRRAGPHHRAALVHAVRRVTGLDTTTEGIPVQGMLDPDILKVMMRTAGARRTTIRDAMPEICRTGRFRQ